MIGVVRKGVQGLKLGQSSPPVFLDQLFRTQKPTGFSGGTFVWRWTARMVEARALQPSHNFRAAVSKDVRKQIDVSQQGSNKNEIVREGLAVQAFRSLSSLKRPLKTAKQAGLASKVIKVLI